MKFGAAVVAAALMLAALSTPSQAGSGTVRLKVVKAGFIIGASGGGGTLSYGGRTYQLSIGGISAGMMGASETQLVGTASNLNKASDIAGAYAAVGAGASVIRGNTTAQLRNANGVVLRLRGKQVGLEVSLDLSGMVLALK
jgi:hypothetical protein